MTDYLQSLRIRPPSLPAYGYEKTLSNDGVLYQLESKRDEQKYKLDQHSQLLVPQTFQHYTRMSNNASDMFFPRKDPSYPPTRGRSRSRNSDNNIRPSSTGRTMRGLSISLQIDQDRYTYICV